MSALNARLHILDKPLTEEQYKVIVSDEKIADRLPVMDRATVANYWNGPVHRKFPDLYSTDTLLNLKRIELKGGGIVERSDLGNYSLYIAKRNLDVPQTDFVGEDKPYGDNVYTAGISPQASRMIRPRGASTVTRTSDGYVLFGRRPENVMAPGQACILPECMLTVENPNPFNATRARLEKETGIDGSDIARMVMTSFGEELTHSTVVSGMVVELDKKMMRVEKGMNLRKLERGVGIPNGLKFKDSSMSTMLGYLSGDMNRDLRANPNGVNPAACMVAVLGFIHDQHGQSDFEKAISRVRGRRQVYTSLESFFEPMGVGVKNLLRD